MNINMHNYRRNTLYSRRNYLRYRQRHLLLTAAIIIILALSAVLTGCTESGNKGSGRSPFYGRETADLSGYSGIAGRDTASHLVPTTVAEIKELMDGGATFAFFASFEGCPYCNAILPYLNKKLADDNIYIGYLDTRANPDWTSNLDIDDYDLFTELFGEYLEYDADGVLHLYVPDLYIIKDGRVVGHHQGVIAGADDPYEPLTKEQEEQLTSLLDELFGLIE